MGLCSCCTACIAKGVLGIVNSLFLTLGILLTIFGAIFYWGQQAIYKWISSVLEQMAKSTAGSPRPISMEDIQTILGTWSRYLTYAGLILFAIGVLLASLAIVGYVGMCCEIKVLVIVYTVVVGVFGLGCIGIVIGYVAFKREMSTAGQTEMLKLLRAQYNNTGSGSDFTTVFDLVQTRLPCCGVVNYTDYDNKVTGWNRTYTVDGATYTLSFPISCCKITGQTMKPDDTGCVKSPNVNNSNYLAGGCYTKLWDIFDTYSSYTMFGLCVAAAVCVCIVFLAVLVLCNMFD